MDDLNDVEQELGQDMTGRVVFATGGDSGIGLSALTAIASANATIVIASLSPTAGGAAAKAAIVNATGNTKVTVLPLDLSDFESVRSCAAAFAKQHDALDVLINDAGIDHCPSSLAPITADGFERVFQVNYLGHFLLTQQLLPALKRAPAPRVINVASGAHASACPWAAASSNCLDISELPPPVRKPGNNTAGAPISNYGITKFLQIYHAKELAARETSVRAFSLEPGFVDTPMTRQLNPQTRKNWCRFQLHCPLTADEGGSTLAFIALAPDDQLVTGSYYSKCATAQPKSWDATSQKQLFDDSVKWVSAKAI